MGTKAKDKHRHDEASHPAAPPPPPAESQLPATVAPGAAPAFLQEAAHEDAGKGVSTLSEDNLVPLIYILQSNSPQVIPRNPKQIGGAAAGDIWLKAMSSEDCIIRGDEGMWFQPCYFSKACIEFVPRSAGGGFVARHPTMPREAKQVPHPERGNEGVMMWQMPNGNEVREVREHAGFVVTPKGRFPYICSLSGTGHSFSRAWMTIQQSKRVQGIKEPLPAFSCLYQLRTAPRKNKHGEWFMYEVTRDRWATQDEYEEGRKLYEAFAAGVKQAAPVEDEAGSTDSIPF